MRKLVGWIAGLVGIAALARVLARRRGPRALPPAASATTPDPADELRRKLSETRAAAGADPAMTPERASEPAETLDERRSRVHEKAQQAIQAMQEPPA